VSGFSLIGHRALDDPRNRLALEFMRLTVERMRGISFSRMSRV